MLGRRGSVRIIYSEKTVVRLERSSSGRCPITHRNSRQGLAVVDDQGRVFIAQNLGLMRQMVCPRLLGAGDRRGYRAPRPTNGPLFFMNGTGVSLFNREKNREVWQKSLHIKHFVNDLQRKTGKTMSMAPRAFWGPLRLSWSGLMITS